MDLTTLTWAASALSAGKLLYEVGSKVAHWVEGDDTGSSSQLSKVNGVNNAKDGETIGGNVDYDA